MKSLKYLIALSVLFTSCAYNDSAESVSCNSVEVSFEVDVMPIIQTNCAANSSCHTSGGKEVALTTYAQIYAERTDIQSEVSSGSMPKNGSLTSAERTAILCWIANGAADN